MCTGAHPIGRGWSATRTQWITDPALVVEIIDSEERITAFLPLLDGMVMGGLVSLEEIRILAVARTRKKPDPRQTGRDGLARLMPQDRGKTGRAWTNELNPTREGQAPGVGGGHSRRAPVEARREAQLPRSGGINHRLRARRRARWQERRRADA